MPTLTRTQPQRMSLSHPGKAKDIRSTIATTNSTTTDTSHNSINKNLGNVKTTAELPRVHSSPSKLNYLNTTNTGKSLSEALIFALTNPHYDDRFFIKLQVQYVKIPSSNLGRTCSAKRRASDKDLPVPLFLIFSKYINRLAQKL